MSRATGVAAVNLGSFGGTSVGAAVGNLPGHGAIFFVVVGAVCVFVALMIAAAS